MYRILLYVIVMIALMFPLTAAASEVVDTAKGVIQYVLPFTRPTTVPDAAEDIADEIDEQIQRYVIGEEDEAGFNRARIVLALTVPVHLSNFEESNPLARQMSEEMGSALAKLGYTLVEIRRARTVQMSQPTGETILTRDVAKLADGAVGAMGILTGTYVISKNNVRFSIKILQATSNKVLGMSSATVPITTDVASMLFDKRGAPVPSVRVQLP